MIVFIKKLWSPVTGVYRGFLGPVARKNSPDSLFPKEVGIIIQKYTVSQNLHKLSILRVFPDFDLKFLCQFFVLWPVSLWVI